MNVLFVCLGNICRSPAAEAILRKLANEEHLDVEVDSAAIHSWSIGKSPSRTMIKLCKELGYLIDETHLARQVEEADFFKYDYILAVETQVLTRLNEINPKESKATIMLLTSFSERFHDMEIIDPYLENAETYKNAIMMIEDSCIGLMQNLRSK